MSSTDYRTQLEVFGQKKETASGGLTGSSYDGTMIFSCLAGRLFKEAAGKKWVCSGR